MKMIVVCDSDSREADVKELLRSAARRLPGRRRAAFGQSSSGFQAAIGFGSRAAHSPAAGTGAARSAVMPWPVYPKEES